MTDNTQPEALRLAEMLTADEWPGHVTLVSYAQECVTELRRQHARIAELESELEAVGAGGVSGPLMGRASLSANAGEPAAYLIDWPDEPELGHYFSESPTETGRCRPLYLAAPPTAPAVAAPDPVAYLYDDGSWTPAKTEEGRKLSNWMISAGSPKIGVLLASAAQPTRAVQATQTGNQREARPCHVFTVRKAGSLTEWAPTSMAFALPDGAHALYTLPPPPTSAEGVEHG